ncbi:MAG: cellulase family glycosylhydrolase [Chloroflexota bacterium]|nr:cellulase family glycosylhydrolase [Chloroflexota bacterium]
MLLLALLIAPTRPALAQTDPRFFTQTNFRVDTDPFWNFFQTRGGVRTFGYPVSRTFKLDGFSVQIFQRIVMQLQSDGSVGTLNLLDAGLLPYTRINGSTFPAPDPAVVSQTPSATDPDYATRIIQFVQANAPETFGASPVNFGATFNSTVTAADAPDASAGLLPLFDLQIWGAPTSNPASDPNNPTFIYLRFQRGIMHYDKGCNCTQGLLLADYLKSLLTAKNLPSDLAQQAQADHSRFLNQYAPGQPLSIARPSELPGSDLSNAFETQEAGAEPAAPSTPGTPTGNWGYGFQVHLTYFSQDAKQLTLGLVKQSGFNWIKHQVEWQTIQTGPDQYSWTELDAIVNTAADDGLKVMLSVQHAPAFLRGFASGLFPADPTSFQTFMRTLASRYQGKVQAYELWNEENLATETGAGNVDPATYLPLLKAGYSGLKSGDSSALALLGAPSPTGANAAGQSIDDLQYLQRLYALNDGEAKAYYDALSAHPSGFSNPPDCTPTTPACSLSGGFNNDPSFFAFTRVAQYRDLMVQNGEANKHIWFTEFGYCSNPSAPPGYEYCASLTAQNQADFLVAALQKARALDYVGGMMVWNLNYQLVVPQADEKWGFSVLRDDWTPRPAYYALAQASKP